MSNGFQILLNNYQEVKKILESDNVVENNDLDIEGIEVDEESVVSEEVIDAKNNNVLVKVGEQINFLTA